MESFRFFLALVIEILIFFRWAINLLCGNNASADIALHFNPRLLQHYVVRNSRLKGQWGNEESLISGGFPIKHAEQFQLKIYVADKQFFITYNDEHICSFAFRIPLSTITHVEISGNIDLYKIEMTDFDVYPVDDVDVHIVQEISRPITINKELVSFLLY